MLKAALMCDGNLAWAEPLLGQGIKILKDFSGMSVRSDPHEAAGFTLVLTSHQRLPSQTDRHQVIWSF